MPWRLSILWAARTHKVVNSIQNPRWWMAMANVRCSMNYKCAIYFVVRGNDFISYFILGIFAYFGVRWAGGNQFTPFTICMTTPMPHPLSLTQFTRIDYKITKYYEWRASAYLAMCTYHLLSVYSARMFDVDVYSQYRTHTNTIFVVK